MNVTRPRLLFQPCLATALLLLSTTTVRLHGATTSWTGDIGSWFDAVNWNDGVPQATLQALIDNSGTAQIALPNAAASLVIVRDGALEISQGGQLASERGDVGSTTDSRVAVDGVGSLWKMTGRNNLETLEVGSLGEGVLTVSNGGRVEAGGGFGVTIGYGSAGRGEVTVTGVGSSLFASSLQVSESDGSEATLTISDGATLTSGSTTFGVHSGSAGTGLVTGASSRFDVAGLVVGRLGQSSLIVADGATLTSSYGVMGQHGGRGMVTIAGTDALWKAGNFLRIGDQGSGTLKILSGGRVEVTGDTFVGSAKGGVDFGDGVLTTRGLYASPANFDGQGTIFTRGLVADMALRFDQTHGLQQTFQFFDTADLNVTLHLDLTG